MTARVDPNAQTGMWLGISDIVLIRQMRKYKITRLTATGMLFRINKSGVYGQPSGRPFYLTVTSAMKASERVWSNRVPGTHPFVRFGSWRASCSSHLPTPGAKNSDGGGVVIAGNPEFDLRHPVEWERARARRGDNTLPVKGDSRCPR